MPALDSWEFHSYEQDGEVQAIAAIQGTEIHFAIAPNWRHRVIARRRTRSFLAPLFERLGFLTTRSEPSAQHHEFLSRIGFNKTWHDGRFDHYMLTELPFGTVQNDSAT